MSGERQAFIGLGANLGDRAATLRAAIDRLRRMPGIRSVVVSAGYETDPVGVVDQPPFLNAVAGIETTLTPEALLARLQEIEQAFGRIRVQRWGPRTLDLDLLAYEGAERSTDTLTLPHPRMFERAFVLEPLREVLAQPPFSGDRSAALRARVGATRVDAAGVRRGDALVVATARPRLDPAAVAWLAELKRTGVHLGLERMQRWVAELGHPERAMPVIHVAGTNGKGSVAAMLETMFRRAGWRTGLYTSPHLVRLGERIRTNGMPVENEPLAQAILTLRGTVERLVARAGVDARPSYFEFMTGLALRRFAEQRCDVAIVEVGMGGRLDATNVVDPEVSVITSIGLDHTEFLGDTLAAIAREKAGIIKPDRPVVLGVLPPEAEAAVRAVAAGRGAPVRSVIETFGPDPSVYPQTNLAGEHQRRNAAVAALVAQTCAAKWRLTPERVTEALHEVDWPGRWQRLTVGGRTVIIDGAHNPEGAVALERMLQALRGGGERPGRRDAAVASRRPDAIAAPADAPAPVVVFGALGAARAKPLLEAIARHAAEIRLVVPAQRRACSFEELEALVPPAFGGPVVRTTVPEEFPGASVRTPAPAGAPVVVTGSLYLAGEVLARLDPATGPFEPDLQDF